MKHKYSYLFLRRTRKAGTQFPLLTCETSSCGLCSEITNGDILILERISIKSIEVHMFCGVREHVMGKTGMLTEAK